METQANNKEQETNGCMFCPFCGCGITIEEDTAYCPNCGKAIVQKDNDVNAVDNQSDLNAQTVFIAKKGFKGYFSNVVHYNQLDKPAKSKVMKQSVLGGLGIIALIIIITILILSIGGIIGNTIEKLQPYSYVSIEDFINNWNISAEQNPDGITEGKILLKSDLSDRYNNIITIGDGELYISCQGRDVKDIEYLNEKYKGENFNRSAMVTQLIQICIPNCSSEKLSQYISLYNAVEKDVALSGLKGFSLVFDQVADEASISLTPYVRYAYTYNIVKSDLISGCAFDCTLPEFKTKYNEYVTKYWPDEIDTFWQISEFTIFENENIDGIDIVQYGYVWSLFGTNTASVYIFVDTSSNKIFQIEYQTGIYFSNDIAKENYIYKLPSLLFAALGFDYDTVLDTYIQKAALESNFLYYTRGVMSKAFGYKHEMTIYSMLACSEDHYKKIRDGLFVVENSTSSETTLKFGGTSPEPSETLTNPFKNQGDNVTITEDSKQTEGTSSETQSSSQPKNESKPVIKITNCPTTTRDAYFSISGTISDSSYNAELTVNGESIAQCYGGLGAINFYYGYEYFELKPGENTITFVLTNTNGDFATVTKVITYNP